MRDEFTAQVGQTQFASSAAPFGRLDVFRNGLLMRKRSGEADYSESVSSSGLVTVTFNRIDVGHFVTLLYRTAL